MVTRFKLICIQQVATFPETIRVREAKKARCIIWPFLLYPSVKLADIDEYFDRLGELTAYIHTKNRS